MNLLKNLSLILFILILEIHIAFAADNIPEVTAKSAIVIEASTGKILFQKNAEEQRYPASTTKIMTLIVALEHGNLDDIVTTSANAANTEGSSLELTQGEQLTMLDLLYGIMLVSGNDATVAVAEHISGSVPGFARLMTEKARDIGANNTSFTNPNGLPDPNHYTTAHDLARITAYGYKNPVFEQIVSTKTKNLPWPVKDHDRELYNENRMLWLLDGANGVKTGYTELAGRCLVSGAQRNGIQLITVVLDSEHMWDDSIALLNYGFKQVSPQVVYNKGDILKTVRITNGKSGTLALKINSNLVAPVFTDNSDEFRTEIDAPSKMAAPVTVGQKVGVIRLKYKDTEIATADLVAGETVESKSLFGFLWGSVWSFFTFIVKNFA